MRKQLTTIAIVSVLVATSCQRQVQAPAAAADPRVMVVLQPVKVRSMVRTVEVVGTLRGDEEATLAAKVAGRIATVEHDTGDVVAGGDVLARVDSGDWQLAVAQKQAALRAALAELGLQQQPAGDFDPEQVPAVARATIEANNAAARSRRGDAMFAEQPPLITEQEHSDLQTAMLSAQAAHAVAVTAARAARPSWRKPRRRSPTPRSPHHRADRGASASAWSASATTCGKRVPRSPWSTPTRSSSAPTCASAVRWRSRRASWCGSKCRPAGRRGKAR